MAGSVPGTCKDTKFAKGMSSMRLILVDVDLQLREKFSPLAYSRPIWELRVGMTSLLE